MATLIKFASADDGYIKSSLNTYSGARSGTGGAIMTVYANGGELQVGQYWDGSQHQIYEGFTHWDTSSLGNVVITNVVCELWSQSGGGAYQQDGVNLDLEMSIRDWGGTVETTDWVAGSSLTGLTKVASISGGSPGYNTWATDAAFLSNINKTGNTRVVIYASVTRLNDAPNVPGGLLVPLFSASNSSPPKLTITYQLPDVTVNTQTTAPTGTANRPTPSLRINSGPLAVTGIARQPSTAIRANPGVATGTGAAPQPADALGDALVSVGVATAGTTALQPLFGGFTDVSVTNRALATGAALAPAIRTPVAVVNLANAALGTGIAPSPGTAGGTREIAVGHAAATGFAPSATVSTPPLSALAGALLAVHSPLAMVEVAWDGTTYVDETPRLRSASGVHDLDRVTRKPNVSQANFELANEDYRYSIANTGSPLAPYLTLPDRPCRITVGWSGIDTVFFLGRLTRLRPNRRMATAQFTALSSTDRYSNLKCGPFGPVINQLSTVTAQALLAQAGLTAGTDYVLEPGTVVVEYSAVPGDVNLLDELLQIAQIEGGRLWFDPDNNGRLVLSNASSAGASEANPLIALTAGGPSGHAYDLDEEVIHGDIVNRLSMNWNYRSAGINVPLYSNVYSGVGGQGVNEVQKYQFSGAVSGSYSISMFLGTRYVETGSLPYNATGADVAAAINGHMFPFQEVPYNEVSVFLTTIGSTKTYTITHNGTWLGQRDLAPWFTSSNSMLNGSGNTVAVTFTTVTNGQVGAHNGIQIAPTWTDESYPVVFLPRGGGEENIFASTEWVMYSNYAWSGAFDYIEANTKADFSGQSVPVVSGEAVVEGSLNYYAMAEQVDGTMLAVFQNRYRDASSRFMPVFIRARLLGVATGRPPVTETLSDAESIATYGEKPAEKAMENAYRPAPIALGTAVIQKELDRLVVPADEVQLRLDGMPILAGQYIDVIDETIPGLTVTKRKSIISNEWSVEQDGGFRSMLRAGAGAAPAPPPFVPTDLAGLAVWYDASQLALADGTTVSPWTDLSGNGKNATVIGIPAPVFKTNILSGKGVVRTTTAQGRYRVTGTGVTNNFTLAYVARTRDAVAGRVLGADMAGSTQNFLLGWHGGFMNKMYAGLFGVPDSTTAQTTAFQMYSADGAASGYAPRLFNNGVLYSTAAGATLHFGGSLALGGYDNSTGELPNADYAEIVLYNTKLSDIDRQKVESYLRTKWLT